MTNVEVLRVERPYSSESEFLQTEGWTVTKKSMFLIGAPPHPEGTILRCELVLTSGVQLLVAEGVVAKHSAATAERPAGLVVRYRRMTPASSQFVARALSNRDAAEGSSPSAVHQPIVRAPVPAITASAVATSPAAAVPRHQLRAQIQGQPEARDVLQRLSRRERKPVEIPTDRATLLSRLRMRTGNTG
jgi:hypothetical protein